uniref:Bassoon (presynaptic cytomatrix protein) b n=1 Tax=Cyprinus carpio TaxID=7962 RepID=A0A8C2Q5V1_CYPCA
MFFFHFQKKEWLCLTCQTQRAMSGSLGDIPPPVPSSVGSPRLPGPANQQQQQGPSQQATLRPTGPQQQKPSGAQVSGPFSPVKQGAPQSKGPSQQFPATKAETEKQDQGINKKQAMSKTEKEGDIKATSKKGTTDKKDEKKSSGKQKSKHDDDSNKSSTQSLSDTGYSSDGISSSQSEITGLIQEDSMKLSERGISDQRSPPSPSELTKLESSMRPLLESHTATDQGHHRDGKETAEHQRPRSLSITQDQEYESDEEASDDLSCKLRHDYVEDSSESGLSPLPPRQKKSQKNLTDEEFMRRQILEMSADEEDTADVEGHVKTKRSHKHSGDLGKERRRLTQQSSSFEEDTKSTDSYKSGEADDMMASQGGLRRFKTIELNNTNSYNRDMELSTDHDLREPELEMESLTGSPEERSRGEYSSTLPATTPSYTSGTSPTSVSSMEDDSDSSPSRRQRLEEAKQQRKARHRSHGPLLPTIEDSSEEDELREEEELLREQEKMRDLEQQRIRSTARKTKRDKEELRAQRRRERSKTPPSNLSPIEDASPTEELRQAAEMEELHRSSCSEYSPSMDSEAEGFEMGSKLYKSGSEYNLPTFMSLYSPTEKTSAVSPSAAEKSLKSAEEVYEEMMRKAEMMQKQQRAPGRQGQQHQERVLQTDKKQHLDSGTNSLSPGTSPTQISAPVSFSGNDPSGRGTQRVHATQQSQVRMSNQTSKGSHVTGSPQSQVRQPAPTQPQGRPGVQGKVQGQVPDPGVSSLTSKMFSYLKGSSPSTSPSTSPTQSPTRAPAPCTTSTVAPTQTSQLPHKAGSPRLSRQQSSQDSPVMVITLGSGTSSQTKPVTVNSSTSPLSSPTKDSQQTIYQTQHATTKSPTSPKKYPAHPLPQHNLQRTQISERVSVAVSTATSAGSQSSGSLLVGNISLCRISTVPGTSRVVEQGTVGPGSNIVDLRAPMKPAPIIMTDQGMDLTSLASDTRRYSLDAETPPSRHTAVQPLIMNLNAQAQPQVSTTTPTTVSVTVAASMFISQPKQPVVYGDPLQNRVDFGQGVGSAVCLTQTRPIITDPSIPKIDACLENLGIQQQQLQKQQQKLQQQQELLEQQLQQHQQNASFARYNLANQVQPVLLKKDLVVSQNTGGGTQTTVSPIPKISPLPPPPLSCSASTTPTLGHDIYGGVNSYLSRDLGGFQESNLAQYSATTAREISRMCAALNSMEQFGSRYTSNPELLQYGAGRAGPAGRLNLQQGLASIRANLLYGPDGRPTVHGQTLTNLINARQASLRSLYPPAVRTADGMIYSTINTPIASTLPITTQPAPVLNPMLRGVYGSYPSATVTAVPLANLTRLPQVTPRMPLNVQGPYRYPPPNRFSVTAPDTSSGSVPPSSTSQEAPVYLGKPTAPGSMSTTASPKTGQPISNLGLKGVQPAHTSTVPVQSVGNEQAPFSHISVEGTTTQLPIQPQTQPQSFVKGQEQTQSQPQTQPQKLTVPQKQSQAITRVFPDASASTTITTSANIEREKEEEQLRLQQEQLLQLERERVELEKLRQLRLQEELERDRMELQRHREKEHLLMQREIQELQTIKQQVLQQQQAERETQLVMQREQLAQQRMQLDQIQSLQQQLQQQLEDQKRQKTAAIEVAAAAAAAEAAAASAAAAAAATTAQGAIQGVMVGGTTPQTISIIYDQSGRIIPQEGQSVQILPCADGQVVQAVVSTRPLPSSSSEMSLKNSEDQGDGRIMRKQNSMPRLRNGSEDESCKRIADCSVQTDDEDTEDKLMSRRRRTRRIADCSVQTDEEDQGEWDSQPIRRRRSRYSKHSEPTAETKSDASKSSIAIQTTNDSSCQTESDQLGRISPAIHITMAETSKVELLHYISAPERTHKGESLACQTDPEAQSQGVVAPQLSVPTTVSPYSTTLQLVGATPTKFERRKPDPLDIGYQQAQQLNESPFRQPPKSPQVLYSPVSPLSPHRMLETTFTSSEKLNKAHVTPQQKAFTAESPQRHQTIPRPIKSVQRSMSDPKPLSPTSEDPAKTKFSLYQSQTSPASQMSALQQQNAMMRKVKRTLPSPPPDETPVPIVTQAIPHIYTSPGASQRVLPRPTQGAMKAGLLSELKAVEQESTKLRKQQAELEEEEKEIDAKLRCLEQGITQRKETRFKERERHEFAYLRCMGDARDYMSDSELNNLRLAVAVAPGTYEENGMLSRPSTAPLNQFTTDLNASQYPPTSSYVPYQYPQAQPTPTQPPTAAYQQIGFQTTPYPTSSQPQPGTFQPHPPQPSSYQTPGPYQTHSYGQPTYESDLGLQQPSHQGFQPPPAPLLGQTLPYPAQSMSFQPHADMLSAHQRPRQTSLADLEQKLPTNYEVISNASVPIATSAQETGFSGVYSSPLNNAYGQYRSSDQPLTEHIPSPSSGYVTDGVYATNLEQNIPRNYVMIDDISELTKENMGSADMSRVGYGSENGPRGPSYGNGSENLYGRTSNTYQSAVDSHGHSSTTVSGGTGYYYDDYKHSSRSSGGMGSQKHSSKNLAPAVSSKRSKHRKQGMEQKISKFSPIEEARDVESDLASYTMTTSTGGSCTVVSRTGVKKSYDQQKYYGSREALEEDDRLYGSGRSRSTGYGMDKISSRDSSGYRSKSYERDVMERSQRGTHGRSGRPSMRTQNSEEESPLSPVGKPMGIGRGSVPDPHDVRNQYGSSHSLPDVQDHHIRDMPKSHVYKPDDPYLADDMHCAVSDSEAYHLGQEETDWFEKPRELRSDRSRHHGSGSHSSSSRRSNVKHTYHDYDEPPEEDLWPQDEYGHQRHSSSTSSREHRHHGSSSGRHSSSRHSSDDPRSSRSSRSHPKDPSTRSDGRVTSSSTQKRSSDPRSASPRDSGDYSRDPSSHHHGSSGQRGQRQPGSSRRQEPSSGSRPQQGLGEQQPQSQQGQQRSTAGQQMSAKQTGPQPPETGQQGHQQLGQTTRTQQQPPQQPGQQPATTMGATQSTTTAASMGTGTTQQQSKPGQAPAQARQQSGGPPTAQPAAAMAKPDTAAPAPSPTPAVAIGSKAAPQAAKIPQIPATGIGSKAAPRPGGIGSAAQQPVEGENVLTKILQGGAAEQAGKIGDGMEL